MTIAPVCLTVHTKAAPAQAFEIFTKKMGRWWPRGSTVAAHPHDDVVVEPRVAGRWFERDADGRETQWGHVLVWDPPSRLVLAWQLGSDRKYDPSLITEVEIRFAPTPQGGTNVMLEHRNLERFRKDADHRAVAIGEGWSLMLSKYREFIEAIE
jgi:uncharacterized protein YndB with AHSA1/START domain